MARGTKFGTIHSHRDLHLIQAAMEIEPAQPKLNLIDVPGADGAKDFSESPAGRVVYNTRKITWTFKLYPTDNWATKYTEVSNALNGISCQIVLDDDPDHYYQGRVSVDKYTVDSILHTITVVAICQPYKLRLTINRVSAPTTTEYTRLTLPNDRMPVVPEIKVTTETTLLWNGDTFTLSAGTHKLLGIQLVEGSNTLQAKSAVGGTITVTYRRGNL